MTTRLALAVLAVGSVVAPPARGEDVLVFAAASLTDALQDVARSWEAASGHKVVLNLGASSDLARQIRAGAAADIFFSADRAQMDRLEREGLVRRQDVVEVLSNTLVVVVAQERGVSPAGPADLKWARRLAVADPEAVPAGVYARAYLESVGLWDALRDRLVPALDVRAALAAVESGHADAGIVYRTDAGLSRRVRVAFEVPREQGPRIEYVVAPLAASRGRVARELLAALLGPDALAVYLRHGFVAPVPR